MNNLSKDKDKNEEENQVLAIRYHDDIFEKGKLEVADEILSSDFVIHNPVLPEEFRNGPAGTKKYASAIMTAYQIENLNTMKFLLRVTW